MGLITASEAITIAFLDKNFPSAKIKDSLIDIAQEQYLRPAIGDDFYEAINVADPPTQYDDFIDDYLQPALAYFILYLMLPEISMQITGSGINVPQTQTGQAGTDRQREMLRSQALANGYTLLNKAVSYIEDNEEDFPLYEKKCSVKIRGGVIL